MEISEQPLSFECSSLDQVIEKIAKNATATEKVTVSCTFESHTVIFNSNTSTLSTQTLPFSALVLINNALEEKGVKISNIAFNHSSD